MAVTRFRHPWPVLLAAALFVAALHGVLAWLGGTAGLGPDAALAGPDSYTRLVRVRDWLHTGGWYDTGFPLANAPWGDRLHWTRPFDLVLIAGAAPLAPWFGWAEALRLWSLVVSPVLAVAVALLLSWATRPFLAWRSYLLLVVLVSVSPAVRAHFLSARPDHHSLQVALFVAVLACLLRHADDRRPDRDTAAGLLTGLAVWVSIEGFASAAVAGLGLGLIWLRSGSARDLGAITRLLWPLAAVVGLAVIAERPPAEWLRIEFDRVSLVHLVLTATAAVAWTGLGRTPVGRDGASLGGRLVGGGIAAALPLAITAALFPAALGGPFAAIDPAIVPIWLDHVSEVQPLIAASPRVTADLAFFLGPVLVGLGYLAWTWRSSDAGGRRRAVILLVGLGLTTPLALDQVRWAAYPAIAAAIPWTLALNAALHWRATWLGTVPLRTPAFLVLLLGHIAVGGALLAAAPARTPADLAEVPCRWPLMTPILTDPGLTGGRRLTILSFVHQGPEIIYRTGHAVVGTPYHRNAAGILDTHAFLNATDDAAARAIARARGVDLVVLCRASPEATYFATRPGATLYRDLVAGRPPAWLEPLALPAAAAARFRLFSVRR